MMLDITIDIVLGVILVGLCVMFLVAVAGAMWTWIKHIKDDEK